MTTGKEIIQRFEAYCPLEMAEQGDPVGLHFGTLNKEVKRVMTTLDVRPEVIREAIDKKIDLLIAKHPPIFRPISRLTEDSPQSKMYCEIVKHDIAVYAAHTNIDIVQDGLNDWFCQMLSVENTTYLTETHEMQQKKLVVFVPEADADSLRFALGKAGAGKIGENYQDCSYTMMGLGHVTPIAGANPTIGKLDEPETVKEIRIEMLFPAELQSKIITTLMESHPYEEPAFDILPVENNVTTYGIGRIGELINPMKQKDFINKVKKTFHVEGMRVVTKDPEKIIKQVAICGGSGEKFYHDALRKKADVYITGDVYYHTAHDMEESGLTVIDPGHHIEEVFISKVAEKLKKWQNENNWDIEIFPSETDTNPFKIY